MVPHSPANIPTKWYVFGRRLTALRGTPAAPNRSAREARAPSRCFTGDPESTKSDSAAAARRHLAAFIARPHADGSPYANHACPIYAAFKDGMIRNVQEEVFWRKDGTSFPVEYTSTPIYLDGKLAGAVLVFRDISLRSRPEERLRAALHEVQGLKDQLRLENESLRQQIESTREKLFRLRFQAKGKDIENPGQMKVFKKDIARMLTVLRQRATSGG